MYEDALRRVLFLSVMVRERKISCDQVARFEKYVVYLSPDIHTSYMFDLNNQPDNMRRYQYLNGKPMSTQLWARSWYKPNDLYSQDSINYGNKIFKLMDDYAAQKQQMMKQAPISSK